MLQCIRRVAPESRYSARQVGAVPAGPRGATPKAAGPWRATGRGYAFNLAKGRELV